MGKDVDGVAPTTYIVFSCLYPTGLRYHRVESALILALTWHWITCIIHDMLQKIAERIVNL